MRKANSLPLCLGLLTLGASVFSARGEIVVVAQSHNGATLNEQIKAAKQAYQSATKYLSRSPIARRVLEHLTHSKVRYTVKVVEPQMRGREVKPAEFDGIQNVICWDPRGGLEWKGNLFSKDRHSAALALIHELGHACHKDINPVDYWRKLGRKTRDQWGTLEEKRTIQGVENLVARRLGELERHFHEDSGFFEAQNFETPDPTSRLYARVRRPVYEQLF